MPKNNQFTKSFINLKQDNKPLNPNNQSITLQKNFTLKKGIHSNTKTTLLDEHLYNVTTANNLNIGQLKTYIKTSARIIF